MELTDGILKDFADAVNSGSEMSPSDSQHIYATVTRVVEDELVYVTINGSELETPAKSLVQVGVGDLVMATMRAHTLTIIGNVSYPALTRVGAIYMTLTDEGLLIGRLSEDNQPIDGYIIVGTNGSSIYNIDGNMLATFGVTAQIGMTTASHVTTTSSGVEIRNGSNKILADFTANGITLRDSYGTTIASFTQNAISIGQSTSATVSFCGGKANIALDGSTLKISGGSNVEAIAISNTFNNRWKAEVVCEAKDSSPKASMQLLNNASVIASLILTDNGVNVATNKALTENGIEVAKVNKMLTYGKMTFDLRDNSSNMYNSYTMWGNASVPDGYSIVGLSRFECSDTTHWAIKHFNVNSDTKRISVSINTVDDQNFYPPAYVYCVWFAVRTSGIIYNGEQTIKY